MGCDIHICCEIKPRSDAQWINADRFAYDSDEKKYRRVDVYRGRNYHLFSMLADVRNHSENPVIERPRGIPWDINNIAKEDYDYWKDDAHSASYLTLKEIYDFRDKQSSTRCSGFVSPTTASDLDNGVKLPDAWCQATSDKSWVYREWVDPKSALDPLIEALEERARDEFWIFDGNKRIKPEDAERFRIVFWFDN